MVRQSFSVPGEISLEDDFCASMTVNVLSLSMNALISVFPREITSTLSQQRSTAACTFAFASALLETSVFR